MNAGPAFAVVGACAVLFGASYAAAELTDEADGQQAQPAPAAPPSHTSSGKRLALNGVERLPDLGEKPRPKPNPKPTPTPTAAAVAAAPAAPAPAAAPTPVSDSPSPEPPEAPDQGGTSFESSSPQSEPAPASPPPAPSSSGPTEFYDSDG